MQNLHGEIALFDAQQEVNAVQFDLSVENPDFILKQQLLQVLKIAAFRSLAVGGADRTIGVFDNFEEVLAAFEFRNIVKIFLRGCDEKTISQSEQQLQLRDLIFL